MSTTELKKFIRTYHIINIECIKFVPKKEKLFLKDYELIQIIREIIQYTREIQMKWNDKYISTSGQKGLPFRWFNFLMYICHTIMPINNIEISKDYIEKGCKKAFRILKTQFYTVDRIKEFLYCCERTFNKDNDKYYVMNIIGKYNTGKTDFLKLFQNYNHDVIYDEIKDVIFNVYYFNKDIRNFNQINKTNIHRLNSNYILTSLNTDVTTNNHVKNVYFNHELKNKNKKHNNIVITPIHYLCLLSAFGMNLFNFKKVAKHITCIIDYIVKYNYIIKDDEDYKLYYTLDKYLYIETHKLGGYYNLVTKL
ncbi:hypothetical protein ApNV_042 [Aratus pisonii nudivirus]|nr:hypothetical protein ApNV_042 [Aratus pisonii nudivirus]